MRRQPLSYSPYLDYTYGNAITIQSVYHSGNKIIDRASLNYVWVYYPDGLQLRDDFPLNGCPTNCWGKIAVGPEKITFSGGEYYHAVYYVGCQVWTSTTNGCYKYEQIYYFYNSGSPSGKPQLEFWLRASGPGYYATDGVPSTYQPYWRVDTDVTGGSSDKYERYTPPYQEMTTEITSLTTGPTDNGVAWRTYATSGGNTHRIEINPVIGDFSKIWFIQFAGTKSTPSEYDGDPNTYVNGQSLSGHDDLYWYRTSRPGNQCTPSSTCSMVHYITLSGL